MYSTLPSSQKVILDRAAKHLSQGETASRLGGGETCKSEEASAGKRHESSVSMDCRDCPGLGRWEEKETSQKNNTEKCFTEQMEPDD